MKNQKRRHETLILPNQVHHGKKNSYSGHFLCSNRVLCDSAHVGSGVYQCMYLLSEFVKIICIPITYGWTQAYMYIKIHKKIQEQLKYKCENRRISYQSNSYTKYKTPNHQNNKVGCRCCYQSSNKIQ